MPTLSLPGTLQGDENKGEEEGAALTSIYRHGEHKIARKPRWMSLDQRSQNSFGVLRIHLYVRHVDMAKRRCTQLCNWAGSPTAGAGTLRNSLKGKGEFQYVV